MNNDPSKNTFENSALLEACDIPQDRYRVFIEDVADAFFETNINGNFVFFNNALCRIFEYSREEIQNQNFRRFMDEQNAEYAYKSFNRMFESGGRVSNIIWEIKTKSGATRILEINAKLLEDTRGGKIGFQGIARDVTDKIKVENALKASEKLAQEQYAASRLAEKRYRALLEFLPVPVFVFNLDGTIAYVNPAFENTFGWKLVELEGKFIPFVPENQKEQTRQGIKQLFEEKRIFDFKTQRLTKDGRLLDIILDAALFYDEKNQPAGQVVTLQNVTQENRVTRINKALFRIAQALYEFRGLDERLQFIAKQVKELVGASGAMVILVDPKSNEFFFREAAFEDEITGHKVKEIRFPTNKGVAGEVYRTGKPMIVNDTSKSPFFFKQVDDKADMQTESMLDVPIQLQDRLIGVLCIINKKTGPFDDTDVELANAIANMVALPIENARINEALLKSYEDVQNLNRAKDRVIHHLSHELKTPVSVLSASLGLLQKRYAGKDTEGLSKILTRTERSLNRILEMQYEIEDIVGQQNYKSHYLLSEMLEACKDLFEALVAEEVASEQITDKLREKINSLFGPRSIKPELIDPKSFLENLYGHLRPKFEHRTCKIETHFHETDRIEIPSDVLTKVFEGLLRNAIENTPDVSKIVVSLSQTRKGPVLKVQDFGVGISKENQRLIFGNYFAAYETAQYSSKKPYDFNAGGKGFDLIRMQIFAERYDFKLKMASKRCPHIDEELGEETNGAHTCTQCKLDEACLSSGTTMTVQFKSANRYKDKR